MTLKNIYIVRHGYRSNWLPPDQQLPNPTGIVSDAQLAPHGVDQAKQLAHFVASKLPEKPQMLFCSPFFRCVQTLAPIADALDLDVNLDRGVGEWFKHDRGEIPIPITPAEMSGFFPEVRESWDWKTVVPSELGETEEEIFMRCTQFWKKFIPKLTRLHPEVENILIATHAATKIALGMSLMGYQNNRQFLKPEDTGDGETTRIMAPTCSLDMYSLDPKSGNWHMHINGCTDFLKDGAEMNWHFCSSKFVAGSDEEIAYLKQMKQDEDLKRKMLQDGSPRTRGKL